ncbi:Nuclear exosomal RNA helicase MTR4, DEAD-box superfamily, partial [Pseudoloma neurophilia]
MHMAVVPDCIYQQEIQQNNYDPERSDQITPKHQNNEEPPKHSNEQPPEHSNEHPPEHSNKHQKIKMINLNNLDDQYFKQYFSFTLDPFQKIACQSIQYNHNVLVCAHTASGKTLIAEYAIHQAIKQKKKIIYTSPIKALSNQKYHELSQKFSSENENISVGLLTGDTTLNPTADILVMTTEILRNMLYKQNINVYYLIFDEIHYMTDRERGVVWEECIIFSTSPCIFLSATVENAEEFASWVSVTQNRVTNIVYNERRVVPLIHYVFPCGGTGLYRIKGVTQNSTLDS